MTHSLTNQSCHAAYSFLYSAAYSCSLCLFIPAYPLLTDRLQSPYQSLTNSAYSLPFLYFNAVSPHVFKPLGSAQWKRAQLYEIIPLSLSLSQYPLSTLSLVGFSEGLKALILKFIQVIQVQVFL